MAPQKSSATSGSGGSTPGARPPVLKLALSAVTPVTADRDNFYRLPPSPPPSPPPSSSPSPSSSPAAAVSSSHARRLHLLSDPRFWALLEVLEALLDKPGAVPTPRAIGSIVHGLGRCGVKVDMDGLNVSRPDGSTTVVNRELRRGEYVDRLSSKLARVCQQSLLRFPFTSQALCFMVWGFAKMGFVVGRNADVDNLWEMVSVRASQLPADVKAFERQAEAAAAAAAQDGAVPTLPVEQPTGRKGKSPHGSQRTQSTSSSSSASSKSVGSSSSSGSSSGSSSTSSGSGTTGRNNSNAVPPSPSTAVDWQAVKSQLEFETPIVDMQRGTVLFGRGRPANTTGYAGMTVVTGRRDWRPATLTSDDNSNDDNGTTPLQSSDAASGSGIAADTDAAVTAVSGEDAAAVWSPARSRSDSGGGGNDLSRRSLTGLLLLDAFLPKEVATLVFSFTKAGLHSDRVLNLCAARVCASPERYSPYDLAIVMWSFAKVCARGCVERAAGSVWCV